MFEIDAAPSPAPKPADPAHPPDAPRAASGVPAPTPAVTTSPPASRAEGELPLDAQDVAWLDALERTAQGLSGRGATAWIVAGGLSLTALLVGLSWWMHDPAGGTAWTGWLLPLVVGVAASAGAAVVFRVLLRQQRRSWALARHLGEHAAEQQRRSRALLDAAPDAIVACDAQGRIRWTNRAGTSIFGRDSDALRDRDIAGILPLFRGVDLPDWFDRHGVHGRVTGIDAEGLRAEGTPFPCALSASQLEDDGGARYLFVVRDATDSHWAAQELKLREQALASTADGVNIVSLGLPGSPIIFTNPAFTQLTGWDASEAMGSPFDLLWRDDPGREAVVLLREAMRRGQGERAVLQLRRKDGSRFWSELALSPVQGDDRRVTHFVCVFSDISERMAQEQALRLRTERLDTVFALSPDGFVALDHDGVVRIVNPAFERMTGLSAEQLVGRSREHFDDRLGAITRLCEKADPRLLGEADAGGEAASVGAELLHLGGDIQRTLLRHLRRSADPGETVMYFRDITRELEVDRMKTEFLSMAAHELRTPMVSIFGFSELLLKRQFDDHRRRDLLGTIHRQSGLLVNLVNELLDLARIEARQGRDFTRRLVPLQPLVERTLSGLLVHDDPRKVETVLPTDPVLVEVDPDKIQQAITNVLSNAYKYSRGQGRIVLDLVHRQVDGATQVGVRIADEGIGMTPEQLRRVFERFYRADTSGNIPGTGLGMAITKEVLELHGGSVDVASSAGKGTTVTLWLPVSTAASVVAGRAAAEPTTPAPLSAPAALPPASLH